MKKIIIGLLIGIAISISTLNILNFNDFNILNNKHFTNRYNNDEEDKDLQEQEKVLKAVNCFLEQENTELIQLSSNLQKRASEGEFKLLKSNNMQINNIKIHKCQYSLNGLNSYIVDVVLKNQKGFQWIQLDALWDSAEEAEEKLLDLQYHPIEYLARLNSDKVHKEGIKIARNILENLASPNSELMGWRYKKTEGLMQNGIKDIEIINIEPLGSCSYEDNMEIAVKGHYKVNFFEKTNEIKSILYLKNYSGVWQLEDIKILDIKEMGSSL